MDSDSNVAIPSTICHTCGTEFPRRSAFSMYEFSFCSTKCAEPVRKQRQEQDRKLEDGRDAKRPRHGAFAFSYGGCN